MRRGLALVVLLFGCGELEIASGELQCSSGGGCPEGYACAEDQHCWKPGSGPEMLGCNGFVMRAAGCVDTGMLEACLADCAMRATETGKALFDELMTCVYGSSSGSPGACPASSEGICDPSGPTYDAGACSDCAQKAMSAGGPCAEALGRCERDLP